MRKKTDFTVIAERYQQEILNEEMPFQAGEYSSDPQRDEYKLDDPSEHKATHKYPKMTSDIGSNPAFAEIMTTIIDTVGEQLLDAIEAEGGTIPDSKQESAQRVAAILSTIKVGERPLFVRSHAVHVARNVVDALVRSGTIKELPRTRSDDSGRPSRPTASGASPSEISFN